MQIHAVVRPLLEYWSQTCSQEHLPSYALIYLSERFLTSSMEGIKAVFHSPHTISEGGIREQVNLYIMFGLHQGVTCSIRSVYTQHE
jgi:hypothetical protein